MNYPIMMLTLLSISIVTISQIMLKISAEKYKNESVIKTYINPIVICAYLLFFLVTVLNVYIFSKVDLLYNNLIIGITYVSVTISGILYFKEKNTLSKSISIVLIAVGVYLVF